MNAVRTRPLLAFVTAIWCVSLSPAIAQSTLPKAETDLLWAVWHDESQADTSRLKAIDRLAREGYLYSQPDSAFHYAQLQYELAQRKGLRKEMAMALATQGNSWWVRGNYPLALEQLQQALSMQEAIKDKEGSTYSHIGIGHIYDDQGLYLKALAQYQRSLDLNEEIGSKTGIATSLGSLGGIYRKQGNSEKALEYHHRSLKVFEELLDRRRVASSLNNIATCYKDQGDFSQAMVYYQRGLKILEELGDRMRTAIVLTNIGAIYQGLDSLPQALVYYQRSLKVREEMANQKGITDSLVRIGMLHNNKGDHRAALDWCGRGLKLATKIGSISEEVYACECLYTAHKHLGNGNQALAYHERMLTLRDSLQHEETTKKLQQMEFAKVLLQDSIAKAEEARAVQEAHTEEVRKKNRTRNMLLVGGSGIVLLAGGLWNRLRYTRRAKRTIEKEKDRSESLLLNILPAEIAEELKAKGRADARDFEMVSIIFTDFKGFTEASAKLSAQDLVAEINACFEAFDGIVGRHGIEKIKTIGDAYMAAGGLPVPTSDSVMNTVLAGLEMQAFIEARQSERSAQGLPAFRMRVGIHTGPVVAGIVGVKKFQYDIWGDTVNTASRMESSGEVGQVNISEATYELVKNEPEFAFTPRGKVQAKGKGEMEMYFVARKG